MIGQNLLNKHYVLVDARQPLANLVSGADNTATGPSIYRALLGDPMTLGLRLSGKF